MVNWWVVGGVIVVGYLAWNYFTNKNIWDNIFRGFTSSDPDVKFESARNVINDPKIQAAIKKAQEQEAKKSHYSVRL